MVQGACRTLLTCCFLNGLLLAMLPYGALATEKNMHRNLQQAGGRAAPRPNFLKVADTSVTDAATTQRLNKQGATAAAIAYLLHGAAEPLSSAQGSSNALLPYLDPPILRRYAAGPRRRSSPTAELLYGLALDLYGADGELQACQYVLYKALRATFTWVRDNVPLRLLLPSVLAAEPTAAAAAAADFAIPDPDRTPDAELTKAVLSAMSDPQQQLGGDGDVAAMVQGGCGGLSVEAFANAVPRVAAALAGLHADLPLLQSLGSSLSERSARDRADHGGGRSSGTSSVREVESGMRPRSKRRLLWLDAEGDRTIEVPDDAAADDDADGLTPGASSALAGVAEELFDAAIRQHAARRHGGGEGVAAAGGARRRRLQQAAAGGGSSGSGSSSSSTSYGSRTFAMPPTKFSIAPPAKLPKLFVPLIFHVMLYKDVDGGIGPTNYNRSLSYINRLVRLANYMAKPTNIQFFTREARYDPVRHPYLLLKDRPTWQDMPTCNGTATYACFDNYEFISSVVVDWPRSINVVVASDAMAANAAVGYAYTPGSDIFPSVGYAYVSWDTVMADGFNSMAFYNDGPLTLVHELFHHLGLLHPFGPGNDDNTTNSCNDDDYVSDTPVMLGSAGSSSFFVAAVSYCMETFWQTYGGDWDATYTRWSSGLGVPRADMNAWADSCPTKAGYDLLGNYMTYNTPVCYAALGHLTRGQAETAHYISAELNPILYAWGQYYAASSPSPPPQAPPPPESLPDACRISRRSACACKASWSLGNSSKSYCGTVPDQVGLWCEVEDPASCRDCASSVKNKTQCVLRCGGTEWMCYGTGPRPPPPPPLPPSLPPMPPPPPPRAVPDKCKVAANGCKCRSTWRFYGYNVTDWSYCASPDGSPRLYCRVESTCPGYNSTSSLYYCDRSLTLESCNVQEVFLRQARGNVSATATKLASPPPPKRGGRKGNKPTASPPGRKPRSPPPPAAGAKPSGLSSSKRSGTALG